MNVSLMRYTAFPDTFLYFILINYFYLKIAKHVIESDYDSPTFACMVSLPIAIMLREQAVWFLITEKFPKLLPPNFTVDHVTSLKDVWKFVFSEMLEFKLKKKLAHSSSSFQIQVSVLYPDEISECGAL